jgi:hypothetical protein
VNGTEEKVREIRKDLAAGMTLKAIGQKFGVHLGTVHRIAKGQTWRHVA